MEVWTAPSRPACCLIAGYRVIGVTMRLWAEEPASGALERSQLVADHLGIPLHVVDLCDPFRRDVVDYLITECATSAQARELSFYDGEEVLGGGIISSALLPLVIQS